MKKIAKYNIVVISVGVLFFATTAVSAAPAAPVRLAWSGWDRIVSWWKKPATSAPATMPAGATAPVSPSKSLTPTPASAPTVVVPASTSPQIKSTINSTVKSKKVLPKMNSAKTPIVKFVTPSAPVVPAAAVANPPVPVAPDPAAGIASSSVSSNSDVVKSTISPTDDKDELKILQFDGTEADYSKSEESRAHYFLSQGKKKILPDTSALLKTYPNLEIHDVTAGGDYTGCIAKNDWDNKRVFARVNNKFYNIGLIEKNAFYACADDMNEKGQVIGSYSYLDGKSGGFLWSNGTISKLAIGPIAINNNGIIIGQSEMMANGAVKKIMVGNDELSFLYDHPALQDINDQDQILIAYYKDRRKHFMIWQNGKVLLVEDLLPKLGEGEYIDMEGSSSDLVKFNMDGSLTLRVDSTNLNRVVRGEDEYITPTIDHLRYYEISLPSDISILNQ